MINSVPFYIWWIIGFIAGFGLECFICSCRKDGVIHVTREQEGDKYLFEFNVPPEEIPAMSQVVFKTRIEPPQRQQDLQSL